MRTRSIIDTANDAFVAIDAADVIKDWNPQAELTFGWTREEAMGRNLAETIIPPAHREAHLEGLHRYVLTGEGPMLNRRVELMEDVRFAFQAHVLIAFALLAFWPFTRLVHALSAPVGYVTRPYIVYRHRDKENARP